MPLESTFYEDIGSFSGDLQKELWRGDKVMCSIDDPIFEYLVDGYPTIPK